MIHRYCIHKKRIALYLKNKTEDQKEKQQQLVTIESKTNLL